MRLLLLLPFLVSSPSAPLNTVPGFIDAPKLAELCAAPAPDAQGAKAICLGYVSGSVDQLMAQQAKVIGIARSICPPQEMTASNAVEAVKDYSLQALTAPGVGAASFVKVAMEQAYPCEDDGQGLQRMRFTPSTATVALRPREVGALAGGHQEPPATSRLISLKARRAPSANNVPTP